MMSQPERPVRIHDIQAKKARGEKIAMLTAYCAWMARLLAGSGAIDMLMVGDSLGMVELGYDSTVPVTMDDMMRHARAVRTGAPHALIVADMPFLSHRAGINRALRNAGRLLQRGGATAVKVEGGEEIAETVRRIVLAGIPVMGHLGLLPQSIHAQGGYRRQATRPEEQERLVADRAALEQAGVFAIVLECVPGALARRLSEISRVPIIGIGSGPDCDGQVLVTQDILGLSGSAAPSFARQYAAVGELIVGAVQRFAADVRSGAIPSD
ncbi:MAG: 3-methyl-2-oxobutanoate hydroxymethyltransferase [Bryobacteraceae bacterium]|jgi:3-methyl-2-oxobutanoate hydroxymethyltransferase